MCTAQGSLKFKAEGSSLWAKVIMAIHCSKRNPGIFTCRKILGKVWVNITKAMNCTFVNNLSLSSYLHGVVGNGEKLNFWTDPWLGNVVLKDRFPNLFNWR
ncbi:hypothetical protein L1987_65969 [Smallanthus sonchifolius]|uniref:Uncharacterized protein n=1 Tax=Smallanthus sonchifolius TaxID=185202 RepID=A0ACB9BW16_9ASTR|nr:hypothetical protein L1987_65969 [Smallanthus sonchifolius]